MLGKGKENVVEIMETEHVSAAQTHIDLLMDEFNEYAEEKTKAFDDWIEFRTITLEKKPRSKDVLHKYIALDKSLLNQVKTVIISEAIQRKHYLLDLMPIQKLTKVCA